METFVLLVIFTCLVYTDGLVEESLDTCEISFAQEPTRNMYNELEALHWIKVDKITSKGYTFKYIDNDTSIEDAIALLKDKFGNSITDISRVQIYSVKSGLDADKVPTSKDYIICDNYYGMGVESAWSDGYSGKGVMVAVTDVGVNTDITELESNINKEKSFNYIDGNKNVTPELFPNYQDFSWPDHGNRCASVIAAVKGNGICSAGIAFNATIAVLKMYKIILEKGIPLPVVLTNSTVMAKTLVHEFGSIDIYSNSWAFISPFVPLTSALRTSIKTSAEQGRDGKGAILVFPAGPNINELMNNEQIITVGAVGKNKTIPRNYVNTSAVLTSGLHDGNNITSSSMVTTSKKNKCSKQFSGVSAATAQVAGMIALALEANPNLTLWDVEDLIVYSSDYVSAKNDKSYQIENAAGHKFHSVFGPGILNASTLVTEARKRTFHIKTVKQGLQASNISTDARMAVFCHTCETDGKKRSDCVGTIKKAKIEVTYKSSADHLSMTLQSPSGTTSVLQDISSDEIDTKVKTRKQILTSVHFWDEEGYGLWIFKLNSNGQRDEIVNISLTLIGLCMEDSNFTSSQSMVEICEPHNVTHRYTTDGPSLIMIIFVIIFVFVLVIIGIYFAYKRWRRWTSNEGNVSYSSMNNDVILDAKDLIMTNVRRLYHNRICNLFRDT